MNKIFDEWYFDLFESGNGSALNQQEIAEEAWDFRQAEVDELQKRIDDALHEADESCGVSVDAFVKLNRILKGNTNEH